MTAFWDAASCSLDEVERRFGGAYCDESPALMIETARTPETSVYLKENTRRCTPEGY
jgi:hypothetical protein